MGWASGSFVMTDLIRTLKEYVKCDDTRHNIYCDMIDSLTGLDWDCLDDCEGEDEVYDNVLKEMYGGNE